MLQALFRHARSGRLRGRLALGQVIAPASARSSAGGHWSDRTHPATCYSTNEKAARGPQPSGTARGTSAPTTNVRRILSKYASYYNEVRTHLSLGSRSFAATPSIRTNLSSRKPYAIVRTPGSRNADGLPRARPPVRPAWRCLQHRDFMQIVKHIATVIDDFYRPDHGRPPPQCKPTGGGASAMMSSSL